MQKPEVYGRYLLIDRVSVGGMAEVFKAMTVGVSGFQKVLAIKRILPNVAAEDGFIKMFVDEANIAGILHHANIAQIYDLGSIDDTYFIAMEYVEGRDLRAIFDKIKKIQRPLPVEMSAFICARILAGLDYAHRKTDGTTQPLNIVHRDVSPPNLLISYEGDVKLIDFGIAKAAKKVSKTQAGVLKGKFGYMSPEQVRGMPVDGRSDVFSVGIVLWEMLAHKRLFIGETDFQTLEKVRGMEIDPPSSIRDNIPEELDRIVLKALDRNVKTRYASASEMEHDLQRFLFSQDEIFTERQLSGWMHEVFEAEISETKGRMQQVEEMDLSVLGIDLEAMQQAQVTSLRSDDIQASPHSEIDDEPIEAPGETDDADEDEVDDDALADTGDAGDSAGPPPADPHGTRISAPQMTTVRSLAITLTVIFLMLTAMAGFWLHQTEANVISVGNNGETGSVTFVANRPEVSVFFNGQAVCKTPCVVTDFWPGNHSVSFRKDGYVSEQVTFALAAKGEAKVGAKLFKPGDIPAGMLIKSDPPGASVWIDEKKQDGVTPLMLDALKAGVTYTVKLAKPGYDAQAQQIVLPSESFSEVSLILPPETPSIRIDSDPQGANIFLNGENTRKLTPARLPGLTNGESYTIQLELEDYLPAKQQATASLEREPEVIISLQPKGEDVPTRTVPQGVGWVILRSEPVAKIYVNGRATGRYTPHKMKLRAGSHRIRLENNTAGVDFKTSVTIEPGQTATLNKTFPQP